MAQPRTTIEAEDARSAGDRVFGTYELCENILKSLPPKDLLRMRQLCCATKSLVEQSLVLKENLFLVPTAKPCTIWHIDAMRHLRYGPGDRTIVVDGHKRACKDYPVSIYNPLIMTVEKSSANLGLKGCDCNSLDCRIFCLDCDLKSLARDALCMNMQLAQPPVVRVELRPRNPLPRDVEDEDEDTESETADVENKDGVQIGEVSRALRGKAHFSNERGGVWWVNIPDFCVVMAEQMQFVQQMHVVPDSSDPWLEKSRQ
ncbi:hypothetical protein LTR17_019685 [Elasticomyces elasticus]|nr:hypothetical protein LTR17_019685 [Elasticomyces elasticus]